MKPSTPTLVLISSLLAACTVTAASTPNNATGDDDDDSAPADETKAPPKPVAGDSGITVPTRSIVDNISVRPRALYSGFDGAHAFAAPFGVAKAGADLTVTLDDPSAGDITPVKLTNATNSDGVTDKNVYFFVTAKKAGTFTILAKSNNQTIETPYTVTAYSSADWTAGNTRYISNGTKGDPPCASCHAGASGIDHSPAALASVPDPSIETVLVSGIDIAGFPIKAGGDKGHKWDVDATQRHQLIAYLRSLAPRGFEGR